MRMALQAPRVSLGRHGSSQLLLRGGRQQSARRSFAALPMASAAAASRALSPALLGLDGQPLSNDLLSDALRAVTGERAPAVTSAQASECSGAGGLSAVLSLSAGGTAEAQSLFVKKISAEALSKSAWPDRRRNLAYARTEARFYTEFAPELAAAGCRVPKVGLVVADLSALGEDSEVIGPAGDEPSEEALRGCGALLLLEPAGPERWWQGSPLSEDQACQSLAAVAGLHAAAWGDSGLLGRAASRLQRHGGAFALPIRNPAEVTKIPDNWARFVEAFSPEDPSLFQQPGVARLGERLELWCGWVSAELSPPPEAPHATLIHGDFKAMNCFLPAAGGAGGADARAMLIDFASTGVGFGMADVAMHLSHSVPPSPLPWNFSGYRSSRGRP
mmetsp:Transcript_16145/g.50748  ORF Transcript_16145/g.50748 Transcript_16145/m.50748 type:complete len:389 (-) Transcript_16145:136-1302(-)